MSEVPSAERGALVWECGPHANAWGGHDARCRQVPAEPDCACGHSEADHVFTGGGFCNECDCERYVLPPVEGRP